MGTNQNNADVSMFFNLWVHFEREDVFFPTHPLIFDRAKEKKTKLHPVGMTHAVTQGSDPVLSISKPRCEQKHTEYV